MLYNFIFIKLHNEEKNWARLFYPRIKQYTARDVEYTARDVQYTTRDVQYTTRDV